MERVSEGCGEVYEDGIDGVLQVVFKASVYEGTAEADTNDNGKRFRGGRCRSEGTSVRHRREAC